MVQLTWPIIALGWVINIFQRGTASMGRIHQIMSEQPEITDAGVGAISCQRWRQPDIPTEVRGDIEFRNLSFHYGNTLLASERGSGRAHGDEAVLTASISKFPPEPAWRLSGRRAQASRRWFR